MNTGFVSMPHIHLDGRAVAWIDDTQIKVREVVLDKLAYGWSAEEIHRQHGGRLSLAQIHAALTYYYDHQAELDAEIERETHEFERLREAGENSTVTKRLRERKTRP